MPTVSGHVYYTPNNTPTPVNGIQNIPVVLFNDTGLVGAIALTDATGTYMFNNVPAGTYQVIEAWGAIGGIASPVDFLTAAGPMPTPPAESEPPLSALPVPPPDQADFLMAISPNLLNITVAASDVTGLDFLDAPVGSKPVVFNGISSIGPNLVTAAANGSFGTVAAGSPVNTIPAAAPYPAATPGLVYQAAPEITDGSYSIANIRRGVDLSFAWWNLSDHETMLETGRFMFVNGDQPGAVLFTDTVTVTPNTNYIVTGWGMNLLKVNGTPPRFAIKVLAADSSQLGFQMFNSLSTTIIPIWYQEGFLFNSGSNSSVTVQIISEAPASLMGNDYVIDEIRMFEIQLEDLLALEKTITPDTLYSSTSAAGQQVKVTVNVTNTSAFLTPDVFFQDIIDPQMQFVSGSVTVNGSGLGYSTADPNLGFSIGDMAPGSANTVEFLVSMVTGGPATIPNTASASYDAATNGNGDVIRNTAESNIASVELVINSAQISVSKSVDKFFAVPGDVLTYTLVLQNTGNMPANNVIITDPVPPGTAFVIGSVTGAAGTPPGLKVASIPAGGSVTVTFKVKVGSTIPSPNPIPNTAAVNFTFTIDPADPNGGSGSAESNTVATQINFAKLTLIKNVDKTISYIGDIVSYQIAVTNTGTVAAGNVVLTDLLPTGTQIAAGSLIVSVPYTGSPDTGLIITGGIAPGQTVTVKFQIKVQEMPIPNPVKNLVSAAYTYTVDPSLPDISATAQSNTVITVIFRYNYSQQINDLIGSVSLEEAALAAIANAEGAKIQKLAAMDAITQDELLCVNKSVADMLDSIALLEYVLKQKLNIVKCQIDGNGAGCP